MSWDPTARVWVGYHDAVATALDLLGSIGVKARCPADIQQELITPQGIVDWEMYRTSIRSGASGKAPREYQLKGVAFLKQMAARGALLADDMRIGKTMQSVLAARALGGKTLIVCPNYVRHVWATELGEWWGRTERGGLIVDLPTRTKSAHLVSNIDVVVIHYDILDKWVDALIAWGFSTLIFDECHALINEKSIRSKAAKRLRQHAAYCWGTTGTPLPNHMSDMWNVIDTLSPGRVGKAPFNFYLRYCNAFQEDITFNAGGAKTTKTVWNFKGSSNQDELANRLKYFMLRRTKSDVMAQLPARERQSIWVDVTGPKKKRAYIPDTESRAAMRAALDKSADAKLPQVSTIVLDHLAAGRKVVAFTWRKHVAEGLAGDAAEVGYTASVAHGGIPALQRVKLLERFALLAQNPGGFLLAATIDAAGVGIDLSWADVILFAELVWEPMKLLQAEARGFSLTNTRGLFIQYVLARGTADELVSRAVLSKLDLFEKVVGSADAGDVRSDLQESEDDVMKQLYAAMGGL